MKFIVGLTVLFSAIALIYATPECTVALPVEELPTKWVNMSEACIEGMKKQIQTEIEASYQYLEMAAYFSRDTVNRPGFAEMFFKSAKEEREHGIKLIEYLSMRGELIHSVGNLITVPRKQAGYTISFNGVSALKKAVEMETSVTAAIRSLIETCESVDNDYHLVDYLTGVYLEEQHKGTRDLAGKLSTLKKMEKNHGQLAEFLFDKQL